MKRFFYILVIVTSFFLSPKAHAQGNKTVLAGTTTTAVNFPGTGCTYSWVNDNTGIGLAGSGTGNIPSFTALNASSAPVTATITVTPMHIGFAYIANYEDNTVSVINTQTDAITAVIPVGKSPFGAALSPDGSWLYITNINDNSVSVINTATNSVAATITVGATPFGVVASPDGTMVYVVNSFSSNISVISTATNTVVATIPIAQSPYGISESRDGSRLYVTNLVSPNLSVINTNTNSVITVIPIDINPVGVCVSPDGSMVYVANSPMNNISAINTLTGAITATIPVGQGPVGVVISPDGKYVYASNENSGTISVINTVTNTVVNAIAVGLLPFGVSVSPDGSRLYVTNNGGGSVSVINTATNAVVSTIPVGAQPVSLGDFVTGGAGCNGATVTFTITVNPASFPTIITTGSPSPLTSIYGTASTSATFIVSASNLTTGILITPPIGFEVSTDGVTYSSSVTIAGTGTIASTTIYIRLASTTPVGDYSGNIVLSSTGATNVNVEMPVSNVTPTPLSITAENNSKALGEVNPVLTVTYSGFVNSDGPAQLTTQPTIATTALTSSPAGQYPITAAGATDPNYTITYVPGLLTINPQPEMISVPNAFTPNGDGVNDTWDIKYLNTFPNCTVAVFNRWGQNVYSSTGYGSPWDGSYNGTALPTGTYYYLINLRNGLGVLSGYVAIIK